MLHFKSLKTHGETSRHTQSSFGANPIGKQNEDLWRGDMACMLRELGKSFTALKVWLNFV